MAYALRGAVIKNDVPLLMQLIEGGADVNGVDGEGRSALFWAAVAGRVECAKVLLDANANVNKADNFGWTPLHSASNFGRAECVKVGWCDTISKNTISL